MFLLFVLITSQIDFVIGSIMGPQDDEEVAKGFVGYNCKFLFNYLCKYKTKLLKM